MQEQFIPYEQAVELKELGFDEQCFAYFSKSIEEDPEFGLDLDIDETNNSNLSDISNRNVSFISAPLWQQAFEFISKKYNYFGNIISVCSDKTSAFYFDIKMQGFCGSILDSVWVSSYEEARLECLKKLIEIVKEQK